MPYNNLNAIKNQVVKFTNLISFIYLININFRSDCCIFYQKPKNNDLSYEYTYCSYTLLAMKCYIAPTQYIPLNFT